VLYVAFALYAWIDFTRTAHDGLANLGLMLVTLPVTAVGLLLTWALGKAGFVLIPSGMGYYTAHAVYSWPSALLIAGFCRNSFFPMARLWPPLTEEGEARCSRAGILIDR
jgi:hypothetical protein